VSRIVAPPPHLGLHGPGFVYKDLAAVVDVVHRLDISRQVVSLAPIGNIKR
jgi:RNA-splicing ligase RtcB